VNAARALSINILAWNRRRDLLELLDSLSRQSFTDYEVVIVDNGSTDGTREAVLAAYPHVRYIILHKNLGSAAGRNISAANSRGEYLLFLDNDVILADPNTLSDMVRIADQRPDWVAVSAEIIVFPYDGQSETLIPDDLLVKTPEASEPCYYDWFFRIGGSLFRRADFLALRGFTDEYTYGGEEWDLAFRVHPSGGRFITCPNVRLFHKVSPVQRPVAFEGLRFQNMVLAELQFMPLADALVTCAFQFPSAMLAALRGRWMGEYCRAVGRILLRLPKLLLCQRTPVSRGVMRRWYYLRTHQVSDYGLVEASNMSVLDYYVHRLREWRRSRGRICTRLTSR